MAFTTRSLFSGLSLLINKGDRVGLVGRNGCGKSTLLKLLSKQMNPSEGALKMQKGTTVGYLRQDLEVFENKSLIEIALSAFEELKSLESQIEQLGKKIAESEEFESDQYISWIDQLSQLEERKFHLGSNQSQGKAERVLKGLGFEDSDFKRSVNEFSGGWKMRLSLATLLLKNPDLLLLDEPTNHLDIHSIIWLEQFLADYPGAIFLVSHDRTFLDKVCNRTLEIVNGKTYDYKLPYSEFVKLREERIEKQRSEKKNQEIEKAQMTRNIERFRAKKNKAKFAQTLIRKLEKMEDIEVDIQDDSAMSIRFPEPPRSGKVVLEVKALSKSYGALDVLKDFSFYVEKGERIAFVGKNGEGKTTLARCILNEIPYSGKLKIGHNVEIGYYAQDQSAKLDGEKTVFQTIDDAAVGEMRSKVRGLLGAFLFSGEDVDKKVKVLSGGERARLALAKLMLSPSNLLILDEPTNHLDMVSKDLLKQSLINFTGTLILVSHDREFLDGLCTKTFEIHDKRLKIHYSGIEGFLESYGFKSLDELDLSKSKNASGSKSSLKNKTKSKKTEKSKLRNVEGPVSAKKSRKAKSEYEINKEKARNERKLKNQLAKAETAVAELEALVNKCEEDLKNPEIFNDKERLPQLLEAYESNKNKLEKAMVEWERAQLALDKLGT